MSFLTDEIVEQYKAWFVTFSNTSLVHHIQVMESLIDSDVFAESLFIDEAIQMYNLLHDECVRRVALLASLEKVQAE